MHKLPGKVLARVFVLVALLIALGSNSLVALADSPGLANPTVQATTAPAKLLSTGPTKVYFADYQHFVADPFLHFWRTNGRLDTFGGPVSNAYINAKGQTVQFFQKMALAYDPQAASLDQQVRPYEIGRIFLAAQPDEVKNAAPYAQVSPVPNSSVQEYFSQTGHELSHGFLELYNKTGGLFTWGYPISEEYGLTLLDGSNYTAQLFERGRMLWSPTTGAIIDPNYGYYMVAFDHANTAAEVNLAASGVPNFSDSLWEHWVDVNLSSQSETFYEGDVAVRTNLVTTGVPGHDTPTGTFYINRRVYNEHMVGGSIGAGDYYDLYNVLYTQYFTYEGHALHYAWWRTRFGVTGSHGCVNEDYDTALFAWNWLTIGSRVQVHY